MGMYKYISLINVRGYYTYRRGVMVARSNELGNPTASKRGASNRQSPRFFYILGKSINQSFSNTIGRRSAK